MTASLTLPSDFDAMDAIKESMSKIKGIDQFTNAVQSHIQGEIDVEEAVGEMMAFLHGDLSGTAVQKERLINLAQHVQAECGSISLSILTFTACTAAISCSGTCC